MVVAGLISMALGMTLGLHCRVFVLFPVQGAGLCAGCVHAAITGASWPGLCVAALTGSLALQIGYLATAALAEPAPRGTAPRR